MAELKWVTQAALAKELDIDRQRIQHWIKRKKIKFKTIPGTNVILVDRQSIKFENNKLK